MAYKYDPSIEPNIRRLIATLTSFEENTELFSHAHDSFMKTLRRTDSAFYLTRNEVDTKVEGLSEKFIFHGHLRESECLKTLCSRYLGEGSGDEDAKNKLAVMQFLFAMSTSPTNHLASLPEGFALQEDANQEKIDWGAYLMEGIEKWNPSFDDSDELSEDDDVKSVRSNDAHTLISTVSRTLLCNGSISQPQEKPECDLESYGSCKQLLKEKVQHSWWASDVVRDLPIVDDDEANIAIRWEEYMSEVSHGLLGGPSTKLLSEYKVLREVIWQFYGPSNSVVFRWSGGRVAVNDNVTIPSLRPAVFKNLCAVFLPDIQIVHDLQEYQNQVFRDEHVPLTYRGYAEAAMSIVRDALRQIIDIEAQVIKQDTTITLIGLGNALARIMRDVRYLHRVHLQVTLDYSAEPRHICAIHMITTLYKQLYCAYEKSQMNVILALYLEASYLYVRIIEEWFRTGQMLDKQCEFPLAPHRGGDAGAVDEDVLEEVAGELSGRAAFERATYVSRAGRHPLIDGDHLMRLINNEVVQIGRQLDLFKLIGRGYLLHATDFSIYDVWRDAIVASLRNYAEIADAKSGDDDEAVAVEPPGPRQGHDDEAVAVEPPAPRQGKSSTACDLLEQIADTSDGFFMAAFQDVFYPAAAAEPRRSTAWEELKAIGGARPLPGVQLVVADCLGDIIKEKYKNCGQILKEVFVRDHRLGEHLALMAKVFLFADDVIFPFYRSVFDKIEARTTWGNDIWLSHDLQECLADAHPRLHERVRVGVRPGWAAMLEDPLRTCTLIVVRYMVDWPVDIIVTEHAAKMYLEVFYFALKIKWALYTLNHLRHSRAEQKRRQRGPRCVRVLLQRLDMLRFGYINVFAALQHYILGYGYTMYRERFAREFEAAANFKSLVASHQEFIYGFHRLVARLRDYQASAFGFDRALYSVRQLRKMWLSPGDICDAVLKKTQESLKECHRNIFDVISAQIYE